MVCIGSFYEFQERKYDGGGVVAWRYSRGVKGTLLGNQLTDSHACVIFKVGIVQNIEEWLKSAIYMEL